VISCISCVVLITVKIRIASIDRFQPSFVSPIPAYILFISLISLFEFFKISTNIITTRNADKAIEECDRLISLYKAELQKNEIATINQFNQKFDEKIGILENNSSVFTAEQIERFKVMQERYYFHVTRLPFEDF